MDPRQVVTAAFLVLIALLSPTAEVRAQSPLQLASPAPFTFDDFAGSVAMVGGDVLVGSSGTVYLYDGTTGVVLRTFTVPTASGSFGGSLAVVGGDVLVGDETDSNVTLFAGAAHLFDATTGALLTSFANPTPAGNDHFGSAVAAVGGDVLVTSLFDDTAGPDAGAVYRFTAGGALVQTFLNPTGTATRFGSTIAALGNDVLAGAPGDDTGGVDTGAVYLFDGTTGALVRTFTNPAPVANDLFGSAVAAVGGNVLVGSRLDGLGSGARVHLFDGATGALIRSFASPDACVNPNWFGISLAVVGTNVLIGKPFGGADCQGAAFLFDTGTGALLRTLPNPSPHTVFFGEALAAAGGALVVGEPSGGTSGVEHLGRAWVFCGGAAVCGPCETCGPAGTCVVAPNPTCTLPVGPVHPLLQVKDVSTDGVDAVVFGAGSWPLIAFGSILHVREVVHSFCLFDESGMSPSLLFRATVPVKSDCGGSPCWRPPPAATFPLAFTYRDLTRTPDGIENMLFRKQLRVGRVKLRMRGRGANLSGRPFGLPTPPLPLPLRMQAHETDGQCWQATYSTAGLRSNSPPRFSGASD